MVICHIFYHSKSHVMTWDVDEPYLMIERRKSTFVPFKKGDKVCLGSWNLKTVYHKKMKPKREGPFPITELGLVTYQLQLLATWQIHNVFHAALL